ncbi:DNAJC27 [Acanthosepion pharaonis]|uniref:DNAJC27 n=1 Tax=Acanthosepion pharaonis TaxID=158019 RepID=A0A812EWS2_ACAPH|nr:DNAJC27 [Sepia pharaonis]
MDRMRGNLTKDYKDAISSIEWIKVVAVGDTHTGKTSLIKIICQNTEDKITDYIPTVGVDYGFKIHDVDERKVRVHLWDLSGDPDYFEVRKELYTGTDILLLIFDVTRPETFNHLSDWINEVTGLLTPPDQCPTMSVLANKLLENSIDGLHQRVLDTTTFPFIIIHIDRPNHYTSEVVSNDPLHLRDNTMLVFVADPLVVLNEVRDFLFFEEEAFTPVP